MREEVIVMVVLDGMNNTHVLCIPLSSLKIIVEEIQ